MPVRPPQRLARLALLASALLALSACDDGATTPSGAAPLPAARPLTVGADVIDTLNAGQSLRFAFPASAGTPYRLLLASTGACLVQFRDSATGELLSSSSDTLAGNLLRWKAPRTSTIILSLEGKTATAPQPLALSLVQDTGSSSSLRPTIREPRPLGFDTLGSTIFLEKGKEAWFKLPIPAGKPVRVTGWVHQAGMLQVFDKDSVPLVEERYHQTFVKSAAPRFGYVRIHLKTPTDTGTVTLHAWIDSLALDAYEPDDSASQATLISADGTPQKRIMQILDEDWFKCRVVKGRSYRIDIADHSNIMVSIFRDSLGKSHLTTGYKQSTLFRADTTGTFTFGVSMGVYGLYEYNGGHPYSITVTRDVSQEDTYEPDDERSNATLLPVGGELQAHYMQGTESDWFKFDLDSGKAYSLDLEGLGRGNVEFFDDSANTTRWLSGGSSFPSFRATRTGRFFLRYSGWSVTDTGAYQIGIRPDTTKDIYEPNDSAAGAALVPVGEVRGGRLLANDVDWFKFDVDSGKTYTISLYGPTNAYMSLYRDSTITDYEAGWTSVWLTARTKGRFYFRLKPSSTSTSYTGAYLLSIKASP